MINLFVIFTKTNTLKCTNVVSAVTLNAKKSLSYMNTLSLQR